MDWWLLHCLFSQQWGQPLDHGHIGRVNCFLKLGSQRVMFCDLSRKSSVITLIRQWNGWPSNKLKFAHASTWTCSMTSPSLKLIARFLRTPIVEFTLVLADDIFLVWFEWISSLSSFQMHLDIAMISDPESRTPMMVHPVLPNLPLMAWSRRLWWAMISSSLFQRTWSPYLHSTEERSWPASLLKWTRWVDRFITCLTIVRFQNCFQNSGNTMNRSLTGTRTLKSSTQLTTHAGMDLSSRGNKYLYCGVGAMEGGRLACGIWGRMVLVDPDGPTDDDDDDDVFLWASDCVDAVAGVGWGSNDDAGGILFDCWISGNKISLDTIAAWVSGFLHEGTWTPSNLTHLPLSFNAWSAWKLAHA